MDKLAEAFQAGFKKEAGKRVNAADDLIESLGRTFNYGSSGRLGPKVDENLKLTAGGNKIPPSHQALEAQRLKGADQYSDYDMNELLTNAVNDNPLLIRNDMVGEPVNDLALGNSNVMMPDIVTN